MRNNQILDEQQFDKRAKQFFQEATKDIHIDEFFKMKLDYMKDNGKGLSPLGRWLEKEIKIPVATLSVAVVIVLISGGILLNSLILPGELPQPKYEIIDMRNSVVSYHEESKI